MCAILKGADTGMRIGIITEDVENTMLMEQSPVEAIANVIDFYFPYVFVYLLDIIEDVGIAGMKEKYTIKNKEAITEENWQQHLAEIFWAIAAKENVYDYMFFNDYYLYMNFFLQYPRLTGQMLHRGMNCSGILTEYKQMQLSGNVYRFIEDVEYMFIYDEEGSVEELSTEDEMLYEIMHIDDIIAEYKRTNLLYQADTISNAEGQVTLLLKDGRILKGVSERIGGIYTTEGHEIREAMTLAIGELDYVFVEEEEIEEIIG